MNLEKFKNKLLNSQISIEYEKGALLATRIDVNVKSVDIRYFCGGNKEITFKLIINDNIKILFNSYEIFEYENYILGLYLGNSINCYLILNQGESWEDIFDDNENNDKNNFSQESKELLLYLLNTISCNNCIYKDDYDGYLCKLDDCVFQLTVKAIK